MRSREEIMKEVDELVKKQDQQREEYQKSMDETSEKLKELREENNTRNRYNIYKKAGDEMALMRSAFMDAGFSKSESMTLLCYVLDKYSRDIPVL